MTGKLTSIFAATAVLAVTCISNAVALPLHSGSIETIDERAGLVIRTGSGSAWKKAFRQHVYSGQRFPYHLLGKYTGDPDMRVVDRRKEFGEVYQCTFANSSRGRYIVCD